MALQGTLDTFALPDVLRLLAATRKTGRLLITGAPGTGSAWVEDGSVVGVEAEHAPHATAAVDALFELLRFKQGSFTFEADVSPDSRIEPMDPEALVTEAEGLLSEWSEIERIVPSMDAWVTLRRTLAEPAVTIGQELWSTVVAIGGGATVRAMCNDLRLAELPMSRSVRDLSELGLVDIDAEAPPEQIQPVTPDVTSQVEAEVTTGGEPELVAAVPAGEAAGQPDAAAPDAEPAAESDEPAGARAELAASQAAHDTTVMADSLPTARPLRARRPKGAAHLSSSSLSAGEPERFVPLDLPGQGPQLSYDPVVEPADEDAMTAEADAEAADEIGTTDGDLSTLPGLVTKPGDASSVEGGDGAGRRLAPLSGPARETTADGEPATDDGAGAPAAGPSDTGGRGLLVKLRSSVKS
ncbi:MAG: DUF4388 domain-containing protein [Actinomycetota bacterium]